jgi:hypothetical protein
VTTFSEAIANPGCGVRFYVKIGGIGTIFIDGEKPTNPATGVAWAAPTSKSVATYQLLEHAIDTGAGIVDNGPEVSRRTSQVSPSKMSIVFNEDRASTMLDLFATELDGGIQSRIESSEDLGYDTSGAGSVIKVNDTSGWSTGVGYIGRETIYIPAIDAGVSLGTTGSKCTRGLFELTDDSGNSYGDSKVTSNPDRPGFTIISDFVRVWHNRWISVRAFAVDENGHALGTAYDDDTTREVWRGLIQGNPRPMDDWQRWEISATSIEKLIDTEVGAEFAKGALMRFPGTAAQNWAGALLPKESNGWDDSHSWGHFFVTESTRYVSCSVYEYQSLSNYNHGTIHATYEFTGDEKIAIVAPGMHTHKSIQESLETELAAAINADTVDDLTFNAYTMNAGNYVLFCSDNGSHVYKLTFHWDASGSIGPLIGFSGTVSLNTVTGAGGQLITANEMPAAIYIPEDAMQIPFYYPESEGTQNATAPASGFARIGKSEIVKYGSIASDGSLDAYLLDLPPGINVLNVENRGALGTKRQSHAFTMSPDYTTQAEEIGIAFGMGFEDVNPLTAILQLAVSTGEAAHHTAYDVLADGVSPPINPLHFDTGQFAEKADQMAGLQSRINWFTSKSHKLTDLISGWLQPFGLYLAASSNDEGEYTIQVIEALPPLESEAVTTVGTSQIDIEDPAQYVGGIDRIVNQLIVRYRYDMLEDKQSDDTITVNDTDSQREYGVKGKLEWKLRGFGLAAYTATGLVTQWAYECFTRYGRPYDLFRLNLDRTGWDIRPGDVIDLTLPGAPTTTGARGYTNRRCVVLQASHTYAPQAGSVGKVGSQVMVIVEQHTRQSTYSPSGRVTSKSGDDVVLADHEFTASDAEKDASHFSPGDVVYIHNAGSWSAGEQKTIDSISGSTVTLTSALSLTVGSATYMSATTYGATQSSQRKHVFISNNSTPRVLSASDTETFTYV